MKKILVILNGRVIPEHVTTTAIELAKTTLSNLHAVFVNSSLDLHEYNYAFPNDLALTETSYTSETVEQEDNSILTLNKQLLKDICSRNNTTLSIENDQHITLGKLIELSAFSDLILMDATENINEYHVIDLLAKSRCPVYLVSRETVSVENIILAYDGSYSSIHAIRQFSRLFPQMRHLATTLVHIASDENEDFPREKNIKTWLPDNFNDVQFKIIRGEVKESLVNYVRSVANPLVVMGSFGRSSMSRLFHKSIANAVIADGRSALFITHE